MTSLASLVLQVNATSVGAATTSLNQLAAAGANAQTATNNLTRTTQQANNSILANQQAWFSNTAAIPILFFTKSPKSYLPSFSSNPKL